MSTSSPTVVDPVLGTPGGLGTPGILGTPGGPGTPGGLGTPGVLGTPGGLAPGADLSGVGFQVPRGDPTQLDGLTVTLGEYEQLLHDHGTTIQTTAECVAPSWTGEAAQAYANLSGLVSAHFHHAANTAADARSALQRWSAELARCQHEGLVAVAEAEHWLAEIKTQQQALISAQGQITTSQQALATAQTNLATAAATHAGAATAHLAGAVGTAQTAVITARTAAQTARTSLDHAHHELAIWQARGRQSWQDAETAAETATGTLGPLYITPPPLAGLPTPLSPIPPFAQPAEPSCQNENSNTANAKPGGLPGQLRDLANSIVGISPGLSGALLILAKTLEDAEVEDEAAAAGGDALALGAAREQRVAEFTGGEVLGEPGQEGLRVTEPGVGSTDVDVRGPNGEYIAVGGPAKAADLSALGSRLRVLQYAANQAGVRAQAYFEEGTPESVLNLARRRLGPENVVIFPKG